MKETLFQTRDIFSKTTNREKVVIFALEILNAAWLCKDLQSNRKLRAKPEVINFAPRQTMTKRKTLIDSAMRSVEKILERVKF